MTNEQYPSNQFSNMALDNSPSFSSFRLWVEENGQNTVSECENGQSDVSDRMNSRMKWEDWIFRNQIQFAPFSALEMQKEAHIHVVSKNLYSQDAARTPAPFGVLDPKLVCR